MSPPLALSLAMFPKTHLTSHSRLSDSRWMTTPLRLSCSLRFFFLYNYSVYSCHLFLVSSAFVRSLPFSVLYHAQSCIYFLFFYISNFLEENSNFSHSLVFLCFFALLIEEGLISPCYFLDLCIQLSIAFSFSLAFQSCGHCEIFLFFP